MTITVHTHSILCKDTETKDAFYVPLKEVINSVLMFDNIVSLGNFNARVGRCILRNKGIDS